MMDDAVEVFAEIVSEGLTTENKGCIRFVIAVVVAVILGLLIYKLV